MHPFANKRCRRGEDDVNYKENGKGVNTPPVFKDLGQWPYTVEVTELIIVLNENVDVKRYVRISPIRLISSNLVFLLE